MKIYMATHKGAPMFYVKHKRANWWSGRLAMPGVLQKALEWGIVREATPAELARYGPEASRKLALPSIPLSQSRSPMVMEDQTRIVTGAL